MACRSSFTVPTDSATEGWSFENRGTPPEIFRPGRLRLGNSTSARATLVGGNTGMRIRIGNNIHLLKSTTQITSQINKTSITTTRHHLLRSRDVSRLLNVTRPFRFINWLYTFLGPSPHWARLVCLPARRTRQ